MALTELRNPDALNRATWSNHRTLDDFAGLDCWSDPGECVAVARVAPFVRGRPILDVGAGAGRTAAFLRLLSDDYQAVDYTPEMVELFRRNHPDLPVRLADARDLHEFPDGGFALAMFSYNGIDAVDHDDRVQVLRELRRVVAPGGWVLFSTFNLHGPAAREVPWRGARDHKPVAWRVARWIARAPMDLPRHRRRWTNWWRNRALEEEHEDWAMRRSAAHDFGLVVHVVSLDLLYREVDAAGFVDVETYAREDGSRLGPSSDTSGVAWFHLVARVPTA